MVANCREKICSDSACTFFFPEGCPSGLRASCLQLLDHWASEPVPLRAAWAAPRWVAWISPAARFPGHRSRCMRMTAFSFSPSRSACRSAASSALPSVGAVSERLGLLRGRSRNVDTRLERVARAARHSIDQGHLLLRLQRRRRLAILEQPSGAPIFRRGARRAGEHECLARLRELRSSSTNEALPLTSIVASSASPVTSSGRRGRIGRRALLRRGRGRGPASRARRRGGRGDHFR